MAESRVTGAGLRIAFAAALKVSGHRSLRMKMDSSRPLRAVRRALFFFLLFSTAAALVLVLLRPVFRRFLPSQLLRL